MEQAQELSEIRAEIQRLKRQNRRLAALGAALVGGCALMALMGAAQRQAPPKSITAREFILVDSAGKRRAVLQVSPSGANLEMYHADGYSLADFLGEGVDGNGLTTFAQDGSMRQVLLVAPGGDAGLGMYDASGIDRLNLGVGKMQLNLATLSEHPPQGVSPSDLTALKASAAPFVAPYVTLNDSGGNERMSLALLGGKLEEQAPALDLIDRKGNTEMHLATFGGSGSPPGAPEAMMEVTTVGGGSVFVPPLGSQAAQVGSGSLCIESHLAATTAFLDGRPIGNTPVEVTIPAGEHAIELRAPAQVYTDGAQPAPWKTTVEVLQEGKQLVDGYYSDHFPANAPACPGRN